MNPSEWQSISSQASFYEEVFRKSSDRFFECETRFGKFKLRSALENVFLLKAHECCAVRTLAFETIRVPLSSLTKITKRPKTYIPDFLVNGEHLIECKSAASMRGTEVREKAAAAKKFCDERDWLYHIMDFPQFDEFFDLL